MFGNNKTKSQSERILKLIISNFFVCLFFKVWQVTLELSGGMFYGPLLTLALQQLLVSYYEKVTI